METAPQSVGRAPGTARSEGLDALQRVSAIGS